MVNGKEEEDEIHLLDSIKKDKLYGETKEKSVRTV